MGGYLSQDPIGLAGGNPTLYGYVFDTNIGVDVLGLSKNSFTKSAPIDLGDGYRARKDSFNYKGQADFEVHVYKISGKNSLTEMGVMDSQGGWIAKHGHGSNAPNLPQGVKDKLIKMCN